MDELMKLRDNAKALLTHVKSYDKFFSSIISFVSDLYDSFNSKEINVERMNFLIEKIDGFYNEYRSDGGSPNDIYIAPSKISRSDSIVRDLREEISKLKQVSPDELLCMQDSSI